MPNGPYHGFFFVALIAVAALPRVSPAQQAPGRASFEDPAITVGVGRANIEQIRARRQAGIARGLGRLPGVGAASGNAPLHHPEHVLVRFKRGTTSVAKRSAHRRAKCLLPLHSYAGVSDLHLMSVDQDGVAEAIRTYESDPNVLYAEPDYIIRTADTPNDPFLDQLWGLHNTGQVVNGNGGAVGADIRAEGAWNIWTGRQEFRIAVIDTGVNYLHPDLRDNIWTNPGEIPGNGVDDDGNGWIDDVHGYDFVNGDGDPFDDRGHGSHVAGILGASGNNNLGVVGVHWRCSLVALKIFRADGTGLISDAVKAMEYVNAAGIRLSNNSWGTAGGFSQALRDEIERSQVHGHIFVAAAGNLFGRNNDEAPVYPASYNLPNIISVASTDNDDRLGFFSDIGPVSVDLGAPGVDVLSTVLGTDYAFSSGTSMATPYVSGVVGLLMSRLPQLPWDRVKDRVLRTARPVEALRGRTVTGGVVNAAAAVGDCNLNQIPDEIDIASGTSQDCDGGGVPDECEADCNQNGVMDECDLADGASMDCNQNNTPDECDIASGESQDCNGNSSPDACDLSAGISDDVNHTGIPDECETCSGDADCDDGNVCTDDRCLDGLCFLVPNSVSCDDEIECTADDVCSEGQCAGSLIPSLDCAPVLSLRAAAVNGNRLPGGPIDEITVDRGDRLTVELFLRRWIPQQVLAYNAFIDWTGYTSGDTGRLSPLVVPTTNAGAFIDQDRADYVFFNKPTFAFVWNSDLDFYQYAALVLFPNDCAVDTGSPVYLGSLILDVSPTASGTFALCLHEDTQNRSFLLECPSARHLSLVDLECVTIHVPLDDCSQGADCNGNDVWDVCDIADGLVPDCNRNDVPDECDFADGTSRDCNGNGLPDECDVADRTSEDCDRNLIPDECQPDCNVNGTADSCDISRRTSRDCNDNAVPDECDIEGGFSLDCPGNGNDIPDECEPDCNGNQVADSCDLARGSSLDIDQNGIPDDCLKVLRVPDRYQTIQAAIDAAAPGDMVLLADGTYRGAGNTLLDFHGKVLTLRSEHGPEHCTIDLEGVGAGIVLRGGVRSTTRIEGLTISNGLHGIVLDRDSSPIIRNCVMSGNINSGIACAPGSPIIEDCVITGTDPGRGILCLWGSDATIRRCIISGNMGGGIFCRASSPTISDCLIHGNSAGLSKGGAIRCIVSHPTIKNCTITDNIASTAGAVYGNASRIRILSSILWGNRTRPTAVDEDNPDGFPAPTLVINDGASFTISYSDIEGGPDAVRVDASSTLRWHSANIETDPLLLDADEGTPIDPVRGQGRIDVGSPCINRGEFDSPSNLPRTDLDGHSRVLCGRVDMGAYEFGIGDFDCDQAATLSDLAHWADCVTGPSIESGSAGCEAFDFEADRDVDLADFAALQRLLAPAR